MPGDGRTSGVVYDEQMSAVPQTGESSEAQRKQRFRRTVILLLLAIALLLLALLLLGTSTPDWQADGSREAHGAGSRAAICLCLALGTMLIPVGLRELILAVLPSQTLGLVLGLLIGMAGLVAVPLEIWLVMIVTHELEPGAQQRYEDGDDDWDWD
jgi:succinate dehydrogenase hydrophobic anchor subunit